MKRELTPKEVIYNICLEDSKTSEDLKGYSQYKEVLEKIEASLSINKEGFNLYIIDDYSKEKIDKISNFIEELYVKKEKPKDICYVILEDAKNPQVLYLSNGTGIKLKGKLEELQELYVDKVFKFYNSSINKDKESVMDYVQKQRNLYIGDLMDIAKAEGFDVKQTNIGFAFIPLKEGTVMTEKEYDDLEIVNKDEIINKASKLKEDAEGVIDKLKDVENDSIKKVKEIFLKYLNEEMSDYKNIIEKEFSEDLGALDYLSYVTSYIEENLVENYTFNYDEDEDKINEIIFKFQVNVIVDNSLNEHPLVIFEQDPTINNLIGSIEYENHNGVYTTDISLIQGGSLLRANEGCLIIRLNDLISNVGAYYYLKKTLLMGKTNFDYNKGYLEFLSLGGLKPSDIKINVKVIIIGDYESYDILYNYDEDFKNLFKLRTYHTPNKKIDSSVVSSLNTAIEKIIKENEILALAQEAYREILKYLSRKAGSREKVYFDYNEINKLLTLADYKARKEGKKEIQRKDITSLANERDVYEEEILELYKCKKILFNSSDSKVGVINGLSVVDTGYFSFGKPIKITCVCVSGEGNIIDAQKEGNLSGNIHEKSTSILKGYINKFISNYEKIPVDFHISFEQIYGKIDGDSASVAEAICMLSSLCKIPIRQNIAITGSMNQFGEVQAIGGVNEKIEGFFNVCKAVDKIKNKGVLIPSANKDEIILNCEVEEAIAQGNFKIITMDSIEDAVEVLMVDENHTLEYIYNTVKEELKKYIKHKA